DRSRSPKRLITIAEIRRIILCTGKKREQIELLELDKSGIHVAEYLTTLPPRAVLGERLQQATERARLQIEQRDGIGNS
ncbi:hypothetical protein ACSHSS_16795, partial [Burkholderia sp. BC1]